MKLKNGALQVLYETIVHGTFTFSLYAECPIDKAFRKCDDKIQSEMDILQRDHESDVRVIGKLHSQMVNLEDEKTEQEKRAYILQKENKQLKKDLDALLSRVHCAEDEAEDLKNKCSVRDERIKELIDREKNLDSYFNKYQQLQQEVESLNKDKQWLEHSRSEWANRAVERGKKLNEAEGKNRELKKDYETVMKERNDLSDKFRALKEDREIWIRNNGEKQAEIAELKNRFDKVNFDRTALQKNLDYYMDIYKKVQDDYDDLHKKYSECQATVDKQAEQIRHLKARLNSCCGIDYDKYIQRLQDGVRNIGYEQGQTDLWVKLQNVNDSQPFELATYFPDVTGMEDILNWDLEDFLDAYKKWQEEKEKERLDHMRDYLARFCEGRVCKGCPLESSEYKCGCGYSFKKAADWDMKIIPDEDLERYYNKAWHGDADAMKETRKRVKEACDAFSEGFKAGLASEVKEVPVSCNIPIKDLASWECTLTANVEVDRDLLEKVCGIVPVEEEHKFEYGDAVRLPWRDYDYMYIGASKANPKHIRLFDPKNRHVVVVSSTDNLKYNHGTILVADEDDLRKIWKDEK